MKRIALFIFMLSLFLISVTASFAADLEYPLMSKDDVRYSVGGKETEFVLDFSDRNLNPYNIGSLKFRFYVPYSITTITVQRESTVVFEYEVPSDAGKWWTEVEFNAQSESLAEGKTIGDLGDEEGKLGKITLVFHKEKDKEETVFIDSVELVEREKDVAAPVITYKGSTNISVTGEKPFKLKNLTIFDAYENREIEPKYIFPDGVELDSFGVPVVGGPYDCKVTATDISGNVASLSFTLTIRPRDTEAPVIYLNLNEITVSAGTFVDPHAIVSDNEDEIVCKYKWEKKSLDGYGRVLEGDHVLTLICEDLTGNKTEKTITVHALSIFASSVPGFEIIRDESQITFFDDVAPFVFIGITVVLLAIVTLVVVVYLRKKGKALGWDGWSKFRK